MNMKRQTFKPKINPLRCNCHIIYTSYKNIRNGFIFTGDDGNRYGAFIKINPN